MKNKLNFLILLLPFLGVFNKSISNLSYKQIGFDVCKSLSSDYGFYYKDCMIAGCFEVFNSSNVGIVIGNLSSLSGYDLPILWQGTTPVLIKPGKSILIGLKSQHPLFCSGCNIKDFINDRCTQGRIIGVQSYFNDSSYNDFKNLPPAAFVLNPYWKNFINCPDSLLNEEDKNDIKSDSNSLVIEEDSILIEPNLFQLFLSNENQAKGIIKVTNYSKNKIIIQNIISRNRIFSLNGLPDFLDCKLSECKVASGKSILLEYTLKLSGKIKLMDYVKEKKVLKINCKMLWLSGKEIKNDFVILVKQEDFSANK